MTRLTEERDQAINGQGACCPYGIHLKERLSSERKGVKLTWAQSDFNRKQAHREMKSKRKKAATCIGREKER